MHEWVFHKINVTVHTKNSYKSAKLSFRLLLAFAELTESFSEVAIFSSEHRWEPRVCLATLQKDIMELNQ